MHPTRRSVIPIHGSEPSAPDVRPKLNMIRGALVEEGIAAFRDALARYCPEEVVWPVDSRGNGRLESVVEALLDAGWRPPAPPEACSRDEHGVLSMVHTVVRGQHLTLRFEDTRTHALTEWTGTVSDVAGSGPVNMARYLRVTGNARHLEPEETVESVTDEHSPQRLPRILSDHPQWPCHDRSIVSNP